MILPAKHLNMEQSFLGFGGYLLECIKKEKKTTVDALWEKFQEDLEEKRYTAAHSFFCWV